MEQVSLNDGIDSRETLAFGLAAGEVAVFVLALMGAYAVLRSGLAGAIAWTAAGLVLGGGAVLSWGRLGGRPMVEWVVLLAGFLIRTRRARFARIRACAQGCRAASNTAAAAVRLRLQAGAAAAGRSREGGAVVIPLALRRLDRRSGDQPAADQRAAIGRSRVVGFFSLAGGTGRTTLAVEVATILAVRGRSAHATGTAGPRVALLDLARRNPSVGLRLGMPAPSPGSHPLVAHGSGLVVGLAAASSLPRDGDEAARTAALIDSPECAAADFVIVDFDCDLGDLCIGVLRRCDQVLVTLTPTASGVVDAYRSTAFLRRIGLRDRIGHVANRWRPGVDIGEAMDDLGGVIVAQIPEDPALADAARRLDATGTDGAAPAVARLATYIERGAGGVGLAQGAQWGSHAG
jgi:cellulose biosynthesis protein BcsQ